MLIQSSKFRVQQLSEQNIRWLPPLAHDDWPKQRVMISNCRGFYSCVHSRAERTRLGSRLSGMGFTELLGWCIAVLLVGTSVAANFQDEFNVVWSKENVVADDILKEVQLSMTPVAGASLASSDSFLYGSFSAKLKLIAGDSSGIVCSFYLTSYGSKHDEIDFEFLGNETGQPYVLHTNIFASGVGNREQRMFLWFDPTEDFHTYSIVWNHRQILWMVDDIPIRVHKNIESTYPGSYPHFQPMVVAASIFDASTWATRGGAVPTKWEHAPFVVRYQDFSFNACKARNNDVSSCIGNYEGNWWESSAYQTLDAIAKDQLGRVHRNYMIYDYCIDTERYATPPRECSYNSV